MVSKVLQGGPSDHKAFVQSFMTQDGELYFIAATYNVFHGNNGKKLRKIFTEIKQLGASVLLLQEVKPRRGIRLVLKTLGYSTTYASPEFCIAYNNKWTLRRSYRSQMSPTEYWTINYALTNVLQHKVSGHKIRFVDIHPPAHVQAPKHKTFSKVSKVLREFFTSLNKMGQANVKDVYATLAAGDDNVDETKGWKPAGGWDHMKHGVFTEIQPPSGTHGGRKIDSFRITENLKIV